MDLFIIFIALIQIYIHVEMHTSPARYQTRFQSKTSPTSVVALGDVQEFTPLTQTILQQECGKRRDPVIKLFLPMNSTQQQRNFVIHVNIYFLVTTTLSWSKKISMLSYYQNQMLHNSNHEIPLLLCRFYWQNTI